MSWPTIRQLRRANLVTHRDLGYAVSSLVIAYCLSGVALNHLDAWDPDFVIHKEQVTVPVRASSEGLEPAEIERLDALVGESRHRIVDYPTRTQVKIYYEDATFHVNLVEGTGLYERVSRRPIFHQANVLHRNSVKPWRWAADVFALLLAAVALTGLFILRGAHGIRGRGKWFILAGAAPPIITLLFYG